MDLAECCPLSRRDTQESTQVERLPLALSQCQGIAKNCRRRRVPNAPVGRIVTGATLSGNSNRSESAKSLERRLDAKHIRRDQRTHGESPDHAICAKTGIPVLCVMLASRTDCMFCLQVFDICFHEVSPQTDRTEPRTERTSVLSMRCNLASEKEPPNRNTRIVSSGGRPLRAPVHHAPRFRGSG